MIRANLTTETRDAVQALRHDTTSSPAERDRVEMILLSDACWSPPTIADHLNYHAKTVRLVLNDSTSREWQACDTIAQARHPMSKGGSRLPPPSKSFEPGPDLDGTTIGAGPFSLGIHLSTPDSEVSRPHGCQLATYIPHTSTQAGPSKGGACPKPTGRPQKKAESGKLVLTYLDECGFAPSQPVTYSWVLPGERKLFPTSTPGVVV